MHLLKVRMSELFFANPFNVIDLAELIVVQRTLNGVLFNFVSNDNELQHIGVNVDDNEFIKKEMVYVVDALKCNNNISSVLFCANEYNAMKYKLSDALFDGVVELLRQDKLFAFWIVKVHVDEKKIKRLIAVLNMLCNLKVVVLEFDILTYELVEEIVNGYLKRNKKVMYCYIAGGNLDVNVVEKNKVIKGENKNFKCFIYSKTMNIVID